MQRAKLLWYLRTLSIVLRGKTAVSRKTGAWKNRCQKKHLVELIILLTLNKNRKFALLLRLINYNH